MADQNNSCQQPQGPQQPYQNQQYQNQQYSQQQNSSGSFDWFVNTPDYTQQFHPQDISDGKAMSILAYFGILFFLPLVVCPQSRFGRFHANQGLILLLCTQFADRSFLPCFRMGAGSSRPLEDSVGAAEHPDVCAVCCRGRQRCQRPRQRTAGHR